MKAAILNLYEDRQDVTLTAYVLFEVHIFEDGMHGLSLADQASADSLMQMDTDAAKW